MAEGQQQSAEDDDDAHFDEGGPILKVCSASKPWAMAPDVCGN